MTGSGLGLRGRNGCDRVELDETHDGRAGGSVDGRTRDGRVDGPSESELSRAGIACDTESGMVSRRAVLAGLTDMPVVTWRWVRVVCDISSRTSRTCAVTSGPAELAGAVVVDTSDPDQCCTAGLTSVSTFSGYWAGSARAAVEPAEAAGALNMCAAGWAGMWEHGVSSRCFAVVSLCSLKVSLLVDLLDCESKKADFKCCLCSASCLCRIVPDGWVGGVAVGTVPETVTLRLLGVSEVAKRDKLDALLTCEAGGTSLKGSLSLGLGGHITG